MCVVYCPVLKSAFCNRRSPICNKDFEICSAIHDHWELLSKSQNLCYKLASGGCRMLFLQFQNLLSSDKIPPTTKPYGGIYASDLHLFLSSVLGGRLRATAGECQGHR